MNKIFLIFLTFISFLSFTQESVKNDLEVESIHVCHWKKVEQGICTVSYTHLTLPTTHDV